MTKKQSRRLAPTQQADVPADWTPRIRTRAQLDEVVERLPNEPGVYVMRDRKGRIVYVGKARKLRQRVRQYFNGHDTRLFVPTLAKLLGDIEAVITSNDKEAMLLENNLIKAHHPRFNVRLRDDKQYLVLRLDARARWPKLEVVRHIRQDGAGYFGPYHSASSARHTLRVVNRHFKLRTCSDFVLEHRKRPCLQYQIDRCPAPCVYEVDEQTYAEQVRDVGLFLAGRHTELVAGLEQRMKEAAEALEFETAARIRDQLDAIETTLERQDVVGTGDLDQDVVGMYREGGNVEFVVMHVRAGKLLGTQRYSEKGMELPDAEVLASFASAYYDEAPLIPDEVLLPFALAEDDAEPLQEWLSERRGRKVAVKVPVRADRKKLVLLAERNAASNFATRRSKRDDAESALSALQQRLRLSRLPRRIECYDVSHTQGSEPVASMVVFVDGEPDKQSYRHFKVKGVDGLAQGEWQNDDFRSMYEVLNRRFRRALEDDDWALPDLMVIDGGKGQLGRVIAAMQDLGVPLGEEGVDVVSLAKERRFAIEPNKAGLERLRESSTTLADYVVETADEDQAGDDASVKPERVFIPAVRDPIVLAHGSSELYLLTRIRDEAHRFAITHHRKRRGKRSLVSVLDSIKGVGPTTKKALIQHFGSVKAIKAASVEELSAVKGVGPKLAETIHAALR
ncbi:MAG TPA: excinuclease ABC subunit UvrC [Enhygromyxa sp.]|nr:excinuclease ABC subunit UvrC [Enhygromyxa sp.]